MRLNADFLKEMRGTQRHHSGVFGFCITAVFKRDISVDI